MLKRLNTDQQLGAVGAQFVPVKLDVDSAEYREWSREHPAEGRSIPKLYVIRADGESLYARSGSLRGDDLPEMLIATLQNAGRILSESEVLKINEVTSDFRQRTEAGDFAAAIKSLNRLKKLGVPGQLESYADSASELNQLVNEFAESNLTKLDEVREAMASEVELEKLTALVKFYGLRRQLNGLKQLKPTITGIQKSASRGAELRELNRHAKIIDSAKAASTASAKKRSRDKLSELIESTDNESVKALAIKTLTELESQQ